MNYLFVHHNFPAQFHKISEALAANPNNTVFFLSLFKRRKDLQAKNVHWLKINSEKFQDLSKITLYDQSLVFAESQLSLRKKGFIPHVIHGHANFGSINYSKEIFPEAKQTGFFEWLYAAETEQQINYTVSPPITNLSLQQRQCNILSMGALDMVDTAIAATEWQKSQFPKEYQQKLQCIHNGIDTTFFSPGKGKELPQSIAFLRGKEVITYTARSLEPHRGFLSFYRSIPYILAERPHAHIVIVGNTETSYSRPLDSGKSYLQTMQEEVQVNNSHVHILPMLTYPAYRSLLQISTVQTYFNVPFTLSWSLLEAMSCACTLVVGDTAPVREVIKDSQNALLTDFHNEKSIAKTICHALENHAKLDHLRQNARQTILDRYDEKYLIPKYIKAISQ